MRAVLIMTWFADRSWTEAFCVSPKPLYEEGQVLFQKKGAPRSRRPGQWQRGLRTSFVDEGRPPRVTGTGRSGSPPPPRPAR